jgi:hypothetical protein
VVLIDGIDGRLGNPDRKKQERESRDVPLRDVEIAAAKENRKDVIARNLRHIREIEIRISQAVAEARGRRNQVLQKLPPRIVARGNEAENHGGDFLMI